VIFKTIGAAFEKREIEGHIRLAYINQNNDAAATSNIYATSLGRQKQDTPLNDRDDIRMLPNTFEAAIIRYDGLKDFVFAGGYIDSWAGYDSGQDISHFKDILRKIVTTGEIST